MKQTTKHKIALISSVLLLLGSLVTLFTANPSPQTTVVQYVFLLSGLTGVIANTIFLRKADKGTP